MNERYVSVSDADLVWWYKMNEGSGTALNDDSGNGNGATLVGPTWNELN